MRTALVCIANNEDDYIEDWIDYHHKLGYDDIFVFMNDWRYRSPDKNSFFIPLDGEAMQLNAYNFFLNNYRNNYDYATFIDVDEFMTLKKHDNVKDFFENYVDYPCLGINWKLFGSSGLKTKDNRPVWNRFKMSQIGVNKHIKTSVNIKLCRDKKLNPRFVNPHFCDISGISPEGAQIIGPFNYAGSDNIAYIAHYITKSEEECRERRSRRRADMPTPREEGWEQFFKAHDINEVENNDVIKIYDKHI